MSIHSRIPILVWAIIGATLCSERAQSQVLVLRRSWSYSGPHPLVARETARLKQLEYDRAVQNWQQAEKADRRAALHSELAKRTESYRKVRSQTTDARRQQTKRVLGRIDPTTGQIDWPSALVARHSIQTEEISRLFAMSQHLNDERTHAALAASCRDLSQLLAANLRTRDRLPVNQYSLSKKLLAAIPRLSRGTP